ncbi:MAG: UPF0262 family protein [Alphaproteobacteria bacterium]|jgi:uncharacterized protein (UPF0262 family)
MADDQKDNVEEDPPIGGDRLVKIELDEAVTPRRSAEAEHERAIAIYDILEENNFSLVGQAGPFHLYLRAEGRHIRFDICNTEDISLGQFFMAMGPLRRVMRDYFQVCETYFDAIRTKSPSQIQAIDMGRRALHNEGSELLQTRLQGKVETDFDTARRLFTLICVLQSK